MSKTKSISNRKGPARVQRLRDARADETRAGLLAAAAELFERRGYADTSLDDVAAAAHTTKGAVYHHFTDKRALFREVYDMLAAAVAESVLRETAQPRSDTGDPGRTAELVMKRALRAYLRQAAQGRGRRVLFQDGMMVLGGVECRAIDAKYGLGMIEELVEGIADPSLLRASGSDLIARLLLALVIEAGQIIGSSADPEKATKQVERVLLRALGVLRGS
jgi:AcrR family transcriptional regulator